jgi:hypothetical protein
MKVVVCAHCGLPCEDVLVLQHHQAQAAEPDARLSFCSFACLTEHFDLEARDRQDREIRREAGALQRLVCPACRRRIRDRIE